MSILGPIQGKLCDKMILCFKSEWF